MIIVLDEMQDEGAGDEMGRTPFRRRRQRKRARRKARRDRKRKKVDEINAQQREVQERIKELQKGMVSNYGNIIDGVDARHGVHRGDQDIVKAEMAMEAQKEKVAGQIKMLLIGGVCVVGVVGFLNMGKGKDKKKGRPRK